MLTYSPQTSSGAGGGWGGVQQARHHGGGQQGQDKSPDIIKDTKGVVVRVEMLLADRQRPLIILKRHFTESLDSV